MCRPSQYHIIQVKNSKTHRFAFIILSKNRKPVKRVPQECDIKYIISTHKKTRLYCVTSAITSYCRKCKLYMCSPCYKFHFICDRKQVVKIQDLSKFVALMEKKALQVLFDCKAELMKALTIGVLELLKLKVIEIRKALVSGTEDELENLIDHLKHKVKEEFTRGMYQIDYFIYMKIYDPISIQSYTPDRLLDRVQAIINSFLTEVSLKKIVTDSIKSVTMICRMCYSCPYTIEIIEKEKGNDMEYACANCKYSYYYYYQTGPWD